MVFRNKKNEDDENVNFVDILREHQDEFFIGEYFVAQWVPEFEKGLFIFGDYSNTSEDEIRRLLHAKISAMVN